MIRLTLEPESAMMEPVVIWCSLFVMVALMTMSGDSGRREMAKR